MPNAVNTLATVIDPIELELLLSTSKFKRQSWLERVDQHTRARTLKHRFRCIFQDRNTEYGNSGGTSLLPSLTLTIT